MGDAVDLRDENTLRSAYLEMLLDWSGTDLKTVYEPFSQQFGYVYFAIFALVCGYVAWRIAKKRLDARKAPHIPYKVLKPPASVVTEGGGGVAKRKRVVAVIGGTGFIGSHVVDQLVASGECYVYVLGRKFQDDRTNEKVDAIFQVDMLDYEGLGHALQGVDSVINVAAAIPTAFTSVDYVWRVNTLGLQNLVKAAQESGVKNFVSVGGGPVTSKPRDPLTRAFVNSTLARDKFIVEEDGKEGMRTCVVSVGMVIGLRSSLLESVLSGKLTYLPLCNNRVTVLPVEYVAMAAVNAEQRLTSGSDQVVGKMLRLNGPKTSFRELFTLPHWPHRVSSSPLWLLRVMVKLNTVLAGWTGWAPFGAELGTGTEFFVTYSEVEVEGCDVREELGMEPAAGLEDCVKELVEKYREREAGQN